VLLGAIVQKLKDEWINFLVAVVIRHTNLFSRVQCDEIREVYRFQFGCVLTFESS
jgi:hypothetical protein